jgi:chemotaxis protein CheC
MVPKVDIRKLSLFTRVAREGTARVSDSITQLTGAETEVVLSKLNFLHIDDVRAHIGSEKRVGIHVELTESPYGYVLFLLGIRDSHALAGMMLPDGMEPEDPSGGFTDMERSAIQEAGNIMTSGYIDGWANVLGTTIDMSTPKFTFGPADRIVDEMGGWPDEDVVFVLDSQITAAGTGLDLSIYTFPRMEALVKLIERLDVETDVQQEITPAEEFTD